MRTTLTLEEDVAREIAKLQKARDESFKDTVNALLRAGLASVQARRTGGARRYRTEPVSLGAPRLPNIDDLSEVLAFAEGDEHR
ncbi:hypothetical protein KF840_19750 [bacterium]|nr:hypothetical protein [bacterium]